MAKRSRVGVHIGVHVGLMGSAVFALRPPGNTWLQAYADARMCRIGGDTAEARRQPIGNALLPKERKAN